MSLIKSTYKHHARFTALHGVRHFILAMILSLIAVNAVASGDKINLNQADAETLQYIPGVGASRAADIVSLREQVGNFKHYDELLEVSGIGPKILDSIKQYGTLEGGVAELTQDMKDNPPKAAIEASESDESS